MSAINYWYKTNPEYKAYLKTTEWRMKSKLCLVSAGRRCEICGNGSPLQAHHYNYKRFKEEKDCDLFCLCSECHKLYHEKVGKLPDDTGTDRYKRLKHIKETIEK